MEKGFGYTEKLGAILGFTEKNSNEGLLFSLVGEKLGSVIGQLIPNHGAHGCYSSIRKADFIE